MKSLEKLIRKIYKETIKSSIEISDIIPSDTLDIFTQVQYQRWSVARKSF